MVPLEMRLATTAQLRAINQAAVASGYEQILGDSFFEDRKPDDLFRIQVVLYAADSDTIPYGCHVFPVVRRDSDRTPEGLDIDPKDFEALPVDEGI